MEASVEQKLKTLFNLQLLDSKLDNIRNVRGELPMEVKDLEDTVAGLEVRLNNLKTEITNLETSIEDRKNAIKESKELIKKYEGQQNNVKNNREYLALSKEVELQKLEIMASEKKIKEFQNQIEDKTVLIERSESELEDKRKNLEAKNQELDSIVEETEKEEAEIEVKREEAAEIIDDRLSQAYRKIRIGVINGQAVVTIERDACGGCFSQVPPQRQLDIRQRKKIIVCENCGRILIDKDLAESVRDEFTAQVK